MEPPAASPGPSPAATPPDRPARPLLGSFIGMGAMACVLFLVLASVLYAPWYVVTLLTVIWVVLFVLGTRWFMTRPWRVALLPVLMVLIWFGTTLLGAFVLGWNS